MVFLPFVPCERIVLSADLELLELLFGAGVKDVGGVRVRCSELSRLQPVFKAREVVQELTPETPGLFNPENNRRDGRDFYFIFCVMRKVRKKNR